MMEQYRINSCCVSCGDRRATGFLVSPRQILTATHMFPSFDEQPFPEITARFYLENRELAYSANLLKNHPLVTVLELENEIPFYKKVLFLARDPSEKDYAKAYGFPSFAQDGCLSRLIVNTFYGNYEDTRGYNLYLDCENRTGSLMGMSGSALIIEDEISGILLRECKINGEAFSVQALAGLTFRRILGELGISVEVDNHDPHEYSNNIGSICRLNQENTILRGELDLVQNRKLSEIMKIHLLGEEARAFDVLQQEIKFLEESSPLKSSAAYYLLAALWTLGSDPEQSQQYLCRAVELDQMIDTRILASEQAIIRQDFAQAEAVLLPIDNIVLLNQKAKVLYCKNDLDAAVSCFNETSLPLNEGSQILLAIIHLKRGTYEDGLTQIKSLQTLYPNSAKILAIQAHLLFGQAMGTLCPQLQYGQSLFVDPRYFLPDTRQQFILKQVYNCLENLLRVTKNGENSALREWAYGMLVSVSMILPGKDARLCISQFQNQYPHSSLMVLAYLVCGLHVPEDIAEYSLEHFPNSGDCLQIKFRLLISQNRFDAADALLQKYPDEFTQLKGTSLSSIRFSLCMQKQDWASAFDIAAKEPNGTDKRRMQYFVNAWSGKQSQKAAAKKLLDFAKETALPVDCANAYHFASIRGEWAIAFKIAKAWYQLEPQLMVQLLQAESLANSGREAKALPIINRIEKESGSSRTLLKLKAHCLQVLGRQNEAVAYLDNIQYGEHDDELLLLRVRTYLQLGQREDAVFCLKDYLNHGYKNKDVFGMLIEILKSTDLVEASRYAMLFHQSYPEDQSALSVAVQLALLAGTNCDKSDFDKFHDLSVQGAGGFRQCSISEALEIFRANQQRADDLLRKYQKMECPVHIYTDALQNPPMGYLLYLQWKVGIPGVVYPLFATGPADLALDKDTQIILDYTACVAAFELDILNEVCSRWHCLVSPHLLPIILQEITSLNAVQISQEESNLQLKEQLDQAQNLIRCTFPDTASCYFDAWYQVAKEKNLYIVCDDPLDSTDFSLPYDWNCTRIADDNFLSYLVARGILSSNDLKDDEYTPDFTLPEKDGFLLGTSILQTLAERGLLISVTDSIQAQILTIQYNDVLGRVLQSQYRKSARDWLQKLYEKLAGLLQTQKLSFLNTSSSKGDNAMPCASLLQEECHCWADEQMVLWCDDRFLNRMNEPALRMVSVLDVLKNLYQDDVIQHKRKCDTLFSRHVSSFLPSLEYVVESIKICPERDGHLRESASLKNLQETVCATLYSAGCLIDEWRDNRMPERQIYLQRIFALLIETLKAIWNSGDKVGSWKDAASDWLMEHLFILLPHKIGEAGISDKLQLLFSAYLLTGVSIKGGYRKNYFDWLSRYLLIEWNASPKLIAETANDIGLFLSQINDKVQIVLALRVFNEMIPFEDFLHELFTSKYLGDLDLIPFDVPYSPFAPEESAFWEPSQELLDKFFAGEEDAKEEILSKIFEQPVTLGETVVHYIEQSVAHGKFPCADVLPILHLYVPDHLKDTVRGLYSKTIIHSLTANI